MTPRNRPVTYGVAYMVLAVAFVLEGISFTQAFRRDQESCANLERPHPGAGPHRFRSDVACRLRRGCRRPDRPGHRLCGCRAAPAHGIPVPDAVGSSSWASCWRVVAVVLIDRNRRFLVGQGVTADIEGPVAARILGHPEIERLTYLHLEFVGPSKLYLVAAVDLVGDHPRTGGRGYAAPDRTRT